MALGALYFIVILGVEYFLWLNSNGRFVLFLMFLFVEVFLLYYYIAIPITYLLKLKKGISNKEASILIGKHFSGIGDKLYNLLDLAEDENKSELLLASIQQRSDNLKLVPFTRAISFKDTFRYLKYAVVPLALVLLLWVSGNFSSFFSSYERVVNYDMAYEPPAPFVFELLSGDLKVLENESLTIKVATKGELQPTDVYIVVNEKEILLQKIGQVYEYTFGAPLNSTEFFFRANDVVSRNYLLEALKVPAIQNFEIKLDYPDYTKRPSDILKSTGNAVFPEGTSVSWKISGLNTDRIVMVSKDSLIELEKDGNMFSAQRIIYNEFYYKLSTSNENVNNYEKLDYHFKVIKDAYPSIKVKMIKDSLSPNVAFFEGEATDDYELKSIKLICYEENNKENKQIVTLLNPNNNFSEFYYTFPSGLVLEEGKAYTYYFEAGDNDGIHNSKTARTQEFTTRILDNNQLKKKELEAQQSIIKGMDSNLDKLKEQEQTLKEINRDQKEKNTLNFNDQVRIKEFLRKQQNQEQLMQKFSKELKENLQKEDKDDELNKMLKERLERQEKEAKKNERLLDELNKVADKIDKQELSKRLEELGKKQKNSQRNLEQLLELTKRYYVTEKAAQLSKDLEKLAKDQEILSEKEVDAEAPKSQERMNKQFDELAKELEELAKDNRELKKPLSLDIDKSKETLVKNDQKEALEELEKENSTKESDNNSKEKASAKAKQKQKAAAEKIQEMSESLRSSSSGASESTITEDAEMLRQILDNLITFSFKQENLFDQLENSDYEMADYSGSVRKQKELRGLFEHIDDSLFALSLRRAELSELVNEQITEVYYNIDKALESLADSKIYQGAAYEQYVINASNRLADFLANLLDNMQESLKPGAGSGNPEDGFQLPDIIKAQGELKDKMGEKGKSGKEGKEGEDGKGNKKGEKGQKGTEGDSNEGEDGTKGEGKENGENTGNTTQGDGKDGQESGLGMSEEELKEIYEIYKEQEYLKQELEKQLEDMMQESDKRLAKKLIKQMEDFENDLLENGITERTRNKMNFIEHQLLKLENAALRQGKKDERESNTNTRQFQNPILTKPEFLINKTREDEILNRQALPLQQNYQERVRTYFRNND